MANQYDTNLKLQAIADAIGDSGSSGLISALEDIADAVAGGGGGGSSTAGLVSDNFSETDTYDLGDYCIHNNTLYVCINAITTPGPWDLSDWQATNAGIQLSSLNSALTQTRITEIAFSQVTNTGFTAVNLSESINNFDLLIIGEMQAAGNKRRYNHPNLIITPEYLTRTDSNYTMIIADNAAFYMSSVTQIMAKGDFNGAYYSVIGVKLPIISSI